MSEHARARLTAAANKLLAEAIMEGDSARAETLRQIRDSFNTPDERAPPPVSASDALRHPLAATVH